MEPALPPYLILASDQESIPPSEVGGGRGPLPASEHRVCIPTAAVVLEAFIRMIAIDFPALDVSNCINMIAYYSLYVARKGHLDITELPGPLRTFFVQFFSDGETPLRQMIIQLKHAMGIPHDDTDDD
jgi:hypothetical protein